MPPRNRNLDVLEKIAPRNKRGVTIFSRKKQAKITDLSELTQAELHYAQAYAATLKATGHSWRYISDTLGIQGSLIKTWTDDKDWQEMLAKVAADSVDSAVEHLRRQSIDLTEMLVELARTTTDDAVKLRAIESALDRVGIAKVNKSESVVTRNEKTEHAFSPDFFETMEALPIETQKKAVALAQELEALVTDSRYTE